jgi:hypothetical protein
LACREGAEITPRAGIAVRPKLTRSCWSDTIVGKSLKKTERERERERERWGERERERLGVHREICFQLVFTRGFPSAGVSSRALETLCCTLGRLLLVWCSTIGEVSLLEVLEMLQASGKGPCLH